METTFFSAFQDELEKIASLGKLMLKHPGKTLMLGGGAGILGASHAAARGAKKGEHEAYAQARRRRALGLL